MRAIYVDPNRGEIKEVDVTVDENLETYVKNPVWGHWRFAESLPEHDAYVDKQGLNNKRKLWYFAGVHVWGPVLIMRRNPTGFAMPATVSVEWVRQHTNFLHKDPVA